nr:caspase family protein [Kibdelosporangium sp. MJ126-NF4]CEL20346.1 diguanylate cyclase/phosphodiesterase (GGDEF & EAL domains) with PAS/PAC sensor(s) [Kibdelosporangium sp. MJ126-NF4]CTQ97571.1 diguanylate cyclase/phosphodiesterase (GGDEF & EAL domains) with PAS/PAC sensor(s) [Kibdelosporangium sp. MJ126-NF4]
MRLPDPEHSYAVLIGASTYESDELPDVPAVRNNLEGLAAALTDPARGSLRPGHCTTVGDQASVRETYRALRGYAERAEDTFIVYFAGHGLTGLKHHELYLALSDTGVNELPVSALSFEVIRGLFSECSATNRVLILDCCFSGRAVLDFMAKPEEVFLGQVEIAGTYTLASVPANALALAPPGETYTAFTGELIHLLSEGVRGGPELLTLGDIYRRLRTNMSSRNLPLPGQRGTGTADFLALTRNPAYETPSPSPPEESKPRATTRKSRPNNWLTVPTIVKLSGAVAVGVAATIAALQLIPPARPTATTPSPTAITSSSPTTAVPTVNPTTTYPAPATSPSQTPTSIPSGPRELALEAALKWAKAFVTHPPGISEEKWLEGLRPYTTEDYLSTLSTVNPDNITDNEVIGPPIFKSSHTAGMEIEVRTDRDALVLFVVKKPDGWKVAQHDSAH